MTRRLNCAPGSIWTGRLLVVLIAWGLSETGFAQKEKAAGPYEVVRGGQFALCRDLERNLNRFKDEPPQVCRRKFDPAMKDFRMPGWRKLSPDEARRAALAIVPSGFRKFHGPNAPVVKKLEQQVEESAAAGKLEAWEARFDLARSGERVNVVLVSRGKCHSENNYSDMDPVYGVLLSASFEIDERFDGLSGLDGDIFSYRGLPYIANWRNTPSAVGRGDPGPKQNHHGYLMVFDTFWLKPGHGASHDGGTAGRKGPICQIGYQRLGGTKQGGKQ